MSKENISPKSNNEAEPETAAKPSRVSSGLTELDKNIAADLIQATIEGTRHRPISDIYGRILYHRGPGFVENFGELSGMEAFLVLSELYDKLPAEEQTLLNLVFEQHSAAEIAKRLGVTPATARKRVSKLWEKLVSTGHGKPASFQDEYMTISANESEQLSAKAVEILKESELAYERITKDQEEIEQLKMETRAMLAELRAA